MLYSPVRFEGLEFVIIAARTTIALVCRLLTQKLMVVTVRGVLDTCAVIPPCCASKVEAQGI
jgi:hypothetical protein